MILKDFKFSTLVKTTIWIRPFSRAIRNLALRAPKPAKAGGLLIRRRSLRRLPIILLHASMISLIGERLAAIWIRPFSRAIRNLALRAPKPAKAGGLLIRRRSLRRLPIILLHASMISLMTKRLAELVGKNIENTSILLDEWDFFNYN